MLQNIQRFGVMPSQKGNVTKEELEVITHGCLTIFLLEVLEV
jgi:hypothetical protein